LAGRVIDPRPDDRIGRDECEIVLADPEVSRWHAVLREVDSEIAIEDAGSTNGTWVNGRRITDVTPLRKGDHVRMGNTEWLLMALDAATRVAYRRPADGS